MTAPRPLSLHTGENRAESSIHSTALPPKTGTGGGSFTGAARRPHLCGKGESAMALRPSHRGEYLAGGRRNLPTLPYCSPVYAGVGCPRVLVTFARGQQLYPDSARLLSWRRGRTPAGPPPHPLRTKGRPGPPLEVATI